MRQKNLTAGYDIDDDHITKSEVGNNNHHKKKRMVMRMFVLSVITVSLLSLFLSISVLTVNAQPYPGSGGNHTGNTTGTSNATTTSNDTQVTKIGICVVGIKSPCNGDR